MPGKRIDVERLLALYEQLRSAPAVARRLGCSVAGAYCALKRLGVLADTVDARSVQTEERRGVRKPEAKPRKVRAGYERVEEIMAERHVSRVSAMQIFHRSRM